MIYIKMV